MSDEVILENGKYRFYSDNSVLYCDRYGKTWRDFCGDSAVYMLFFEYRELRQKLEKITEILEDSTE